MLRYVLKRTVRSLLTVVVVFVAVFMLLRFMPENGYFTKEMLHELDEMTKQSYLRSQGLLDPPLTQLWNFVRQLFSGDLGRSLTVSPKVPIATISEGLDNYHLYASEQERADKVRKIMEEVGLNVEFISRFPHEFSGGQRQRIGIARSLVMDPEFVIADEPISALDVSIRAQVINLLNKLKKERNLTYLFIAHGLSVVRFISDRIAVIYKGRLVEMAQNDELFAHPLHPYTKALLSAVPVPDPDQERKKVLLTYDPSQHDYSKDGPEWVEISPKHFVLANHTEAEQYQRELND